jgi:dienelactone hydrolase
MGWWNQEGAMPAIDRALDWIDAQPGLDGRRIVLAGLSNGGVGVQRAAMAFPERWRGVVFLNGVMDEKRLASLAACEAPFLVVTGAAEDRIPLEYTDAWVDVLRAGSARVHYEVFPGEDHFLLFSQPDAVMALLGGWMEAEITPADSAPDRRDPPG